MPQKEYFHVKRFINRLTSVINQNNSIQFYDQIKYALQVFRTRLANVIFLCKHDGGGPRDVYASLVQKETCIEIPNSFDDSNIREATNNCTSPSDACEKSKRQMNPIHYPLSMHGFISILVLQTRSLTLYLMAYKVLNLNNL